MLRLDPPLAAARPRPPPLLLELPQHLLHDAPELLQFYDNDVAIP
jgi:hypothetical protein